MDKVKILRITTEPTAGQVTLDLELTVGTQVQLRSVTTSLAPFQGLDAKQTENHLINILACELKQYTDALDVLKSNFIVEFEGREYVF